MSNHTEQRKVILEKFQTAIEHRITPELLNQYSYGAIYDIFWDDMIVRLNRFIPSYRCPNFLANCPKDWFQAFKERFAPKWILKKWPVVYRDLEIEVRQLYPDFALPDTKGYWHFQPVPKETYE